MAKGGQTRATLIETNRKFIKQLATVYSYRGHYLLDYEELVAEGYLLASELVRVLTTEEFQHDFKASLRNRYKNLMGRAFNQRRKGNWVIADLSEAYDLIGEDGVEAIYQKRKLEHLRGMLTPMARSVLRELINPSEKTIDLAKREYENKKDIMKRNVSYKITNGVIRRSLKVPIRLRLVS